METETGRYLPVQVRLWCRAWLDVLTDHTRYQQDAERRSCQEGASLRQVADRTSCDTEDMSLSAARTADTCRRASNVIQNSSWTETSTEDGLLYGLMVRLALWPHMFWSSSAEQVRPHLVSYLVSLSETSEGRQWAEATWSSDWNVVSNQQSFTDQATDQ